MDYLPLLSALGASLIIMMISLTGVITTIQWLKRRAEKEIHLLSSFSAGVFLIVGVFLLLELIEHSETRTIGLLSLSAGAILMVVLARIPEFHHHHSKEEGHHEHSRGAVSRILISDALHNVGDGMLIGVAFATDISLGIVTTIGIAIHELLQELSEFFLLVQHGLSPRRALITNLLVSSSILIGVALSALFIHHEAAESIIVGLSAGTILTVVFHDLIPNVRQVSTAQGKVVRHITAFTLGGLLMVALSLLVGH